MREIKFRAWVGDDIYQMFEVYMIDFSENYVRLKNSERGELPWRYEINDRLFIMQYTGLRDKNGKEIYEGDVVRGEHGQTCTVDWNDAIDPDYYWGYGCGFFWTLVDYLRDSPSYADPRSIEVIGNVHENPELVAK